MRLFGWPAAILSSVILTQLEQSVSIFAGRGFAKLLK